jgi:large subunit ribosomal protein L9
MKVILNKDLSPLGEEGDVKDVARGYARNYLFPRGIALPYNEGTMRLFESRRGEIEARKAEKRDAARGLKERIEALDIQLSMPAGINGRLFGSVTSQTVADELSRQGFQIERKRIELPVSSFKSVGKYKVVVRLYEDATAELTITVRAQEKVEEASPAARGRRHRADEGTTPASASADAELTTEEASPAAPAEEAAPVETAEPTETVAAPEAAAVEEAPVTGEAPESPDTEAPGSPQS